MSRKNYIEILSNFKGDPSIFSKMSQIEIEDALNDTAKQMKGSMSNIERIMLQEDRLNLRAALLALQKKEKV